jgi:restriction system protein
MSVPKAKDLLNLVVQALQDLGGEAHLVDLDNYVTVLLDLSDSQLAEIHDKSRTEIAYQLAWTRTYLRRYGLLESPRRGVWALTEKGKQVDSVGVADVMRAIRSPSPNRTSA